MIRISHRELAKSFGYKDPQSFSRYIANNLSKIEAKVGKLTYVKSPYGGHYNLNIDQSLGINALRGLHRKFTDTKFSEEQIRKQFYEKSDRAIASHKKSVKPASSKGATTIEQFAKATGNRIEYLVSNKDGELRISHRVMSEDGARVFDCTTSGLDQYVTKRDKKGRVNGKIITVYRKTKFSLPKSNPFKHILLTEAQWRSINDARNDYGPCHIYDAADKRISELFAEARKLVAEKSEDKEPSTPARPTTNNPRIKSKAGHPKFIRIDYLATALKVTTKEVTAFLKADSDLPVTRNDSTPDGYVDKETAFGIMCVQSGYVADSWKTITSYANAQEKAGGAAHIEEVKKSMEDFLSLLSSDYNSGSISSITRVREYIALTLRSMKENPKLVDPLANILAYDIQEAKDGLKNK